MALKWSVGHCGIEGNERVDREAKKAASGTTSVGTHYCLAVGNDKGLELDETDEDQELGESDEEEIEKDES